MDPYKQQVSDDAGFVGCNLRLEPQLLPDGVASDAQNYRFRNGVAQPRKGVMKLGWTNRSSVADGSISPFGVVYGVGRFQDPLSREWVIVATDGGVYRCREHNLAVAIPLPAGVKIASPVKIRAAFNKVYMLRGKVLSPLVMSDLDVGFVDLVPKFDANRVGVYQPGEEVAFGPWLVTAYQVSLTSLTSVGTTATAAAPGHGFQAGWSITIAGAAPGGYNGTFVISNVTVDTFDYTLGGALASPATGTITADAPPVYRLGTNKVYVKTQNAHGYGTGQDVTVRGAVQAEFNGRWSITVIDDNTFSFDASGSTSPATGTITVSSMTGYYQCVTSPAGPPYNDPPDAGKWKAIYNILPNCTDALYINNRFLAMTGWTPGATGFSASSSYGKVDFLIATDYIDQTHFGFFNEFRINQGSDDELVQLVKFGEDTVVCFKGGSWGLLTMPAEDSPRLDIPGTEYGLAANGAAVAVGREIYFMSERRGVVALAQTEQSKLQSVDMPLSDAIQPLIDRINWRYKDGIRLAQWDNKLYAAVPLDDALQNGPAQLVEAGVKYADYPHNGLLGRYVVTGWKAGETYHYRPGLNEEFLQVQYQTGVIFVKAEGDFTIPAGSNTLVAIFSLLPGGTAVTARVTPAAPRYGNTAVLVYDFLTQYWTPRDTGRALCVQEFFRAHYNGVERLFFIGTDGYINLMEESDGGDQVRTGPATLGFDEIYQLLKTRAYSERDTESQLLRTKAGDTQNVLKLKLQLETWTPSYAVTLVYDGVNEEQQLDADGNVVFTKDRTKYYRPFDAADWSPTNVNGDHATPNRQDYSVVLNDPAGLYLGGGLQLDAMQTALERFGARLRRGGYVQVKVENTTGRLAVKTVEVEGVKRKERAGTIN